MPVFGSQIDAQRIPVKGLVPEESATAPTTPVDGQFWKDTSLTPPRVKVYVNGTWHIVDSIDDEKTANKGVANGYAPLDASADVPLANLPVAASGTSNATQVVRADDSRLSNSRPPSGAAGGDLTGTYPNPTVANLAITDAKVAAANKDGLAAVPSMRTLGTGAQQAVAGNDSRLSNARTPTGSAGGDLAGTYPNPTIALLAVTDAKVAAANKDGAAATPSMRTLGTGATQALAGNTRLDQVTAPTSAVNLNSQKISNLADPTADTDAANKRYVDSARAGLRLKEAVKAATTANVTLSGTQTIDGVAVVAGDRVLVKNQSTASANGIYVVASGAWTRDTDADSFEELQDGATTFVQQGTAQGNTTWAQVNTLTALTDAQSWVQQGAAASYEAGAGLTQSGNTFNVVAADGSISVSADAITVGNVPVAKGGTGATTATAARTNLGAVGKYAADLGALTAGSEASITHGLNSLDVIASFRGKTSGAEEILDWRVIDANTIGVTSHVAYSASTLRVTVIG